MEEPLPKSIGVFYLRRILNRAKHNPNQKYITISMEKAKEIVEQSNQMLPSGVYTTKQNSVRGAALVLCIDAAELCVRLNGKTPREYMNEIAELKNKIKQLEVSGDAMAEHCTNPDVYVRAWVRAKNI
jgi:hypothetical protein